MTGATDRDLLQTLSGTGSWVAIVWERGAKIGHALVINGLDETGQLAIRDPWGHSRLSKLGSRYTMEEQEFLQIWTREAVFLR
jgi:Papain-like cysteine protease AvrRpt2